MKTILIVGSGAREHALGWKLAQSSQVSKIIIAPGNAGMPSSWERWQIALSKDKEAFADLANRAIDARVDLAVIGPDNPLADGIVDVFEEKGILTFGPRAAAAQIEASKSFAKEIMVAADVPTARYWVAHTEEEAKKILKSVPWKNHSAQKNAPLGWVIKADGLALGKGVRVCTSLSDALIAATDLIQISNSLVIEEMLSGEEISWMAICDGQNCALLDPARDYKRLLNDNEGPNTGGMGAYSPIQNIPIGFEKRIRERVFLPVLKELNRRGAEFKGVLYAGLMVDFKKDQFWVLEFNSRFGDPETQVLLPRIEGDVDVWFEAAARGNLSILPDRVPFRLDAAVYVVAAAKGYPENPETGKIIEGQSDSIFYAGVKKENSDLLTSGGRVFGALGMGEDLERAKASAYLKLKQIHFEGMQFRSDIAADPLKKRI